MTIAANTLNHCFTKKHLIDVIFLTRCWKPYWNIFVQVCCYCRSLNVKILTVSIDYLISLLKRVSFLTYWYMFSTIWGTQSMLREMRVQSFSPKALQSNQWIQSRLLRCLIWVSINLWLKKSEITVGHLKCPSRVSSVEHYRISLFGSITLLT